MTKFIQIAVCAEYNALVLFALDNEGQVWQRDSVYDPEGNVARFVWVLQEYGRR